MPSLRLTLLRTSSLPNLQHYLLLFMIINFFVKFSFFGRLGKYPPFAASIRIFAQHVVAMDVASSRECLPRGRRTIIQDVSRMPYKGCGIQAHKAWDCGEEDDKEVNKFPLNRGNNKPRRCEQHVKNYDFKTHLSSKLTNLIANNCIKLLLLTSEQNLCEMALVENAARNGAVCFTTIQRKFVYFFVIFFPTVPRSISP